MREYGERVKGCTSTGEVGVGEGTTAQAALY